MKIEYKRLEEDFRRSGWNVLKIKDIFDLFPTATYSRADLNETDEIKYIHYGDIHTKYHFHLNIQTSDLPRISNDLAKKYTFVEEGDLIISDASEDYDGVGKTVEVINAYDEKIIAGLHTFHLRDKYKTFSPRFRGFALLSPFVREQFYRLATGTKVYSISKDALNNIKIPIPPLDEQQIIAECLSLWDKAIDKQIALIDAKQERQKAFLQQLTSGKKRLPGFSEKWTEMKLGDLFSERTETKLKNLPLLSIGQDGVYPQNESKKRDISNDDKSKYKRIKPNDIGYNTMRMWQGRSALSKIEGIVSPAYTILVPNESTNSYYFSLLFKTSRLTNLFWRNSQGLVDDTLNCKYKDFAIIKHIVPSFEEQSAIANIFIASEKEIDFEKEKLQELRRQKRSLMQQLLTGKIRLIA